MTSLLHLHDSDPTSSSALNHDVYVNAYTFTKITSLKRLVIQGPLEILNRYLLQLSEPTVFAPHLETLEILILEPRQRWYEISLGMTFQQLDRYIQLHPSLQCVIFARNRKFGQQGHTFEAEVRKYMPRCVGKGIVEFRTI